MWDVQQLNRKLSTELFLIDSTWWSVFDYHLEQIIKFKDFYQLVEAQQLCLLVQWIVEWKLGVQDTIAS